MGPESLHSNGFPGDTAATGPEQAFENHSSPKPEGSPLPVEEAEARRDRVVLVASPH